jgi:hypothetical protein
MKKVLPPEKDIPKNRTTTNRTTQIPKPHLFISKQMDARKLDTFVNLPIFCATFFFSGTKSLAFTFFMNPPIFIAVHVGAGIY